MSRNLDEAATLLPTSGYFLVHFDKDQQRLKWVTLPEEVANRNLGTVVAATRYLVPALAQLREMVDPLVPLTRAGDLQNADSAENSTPKRERRPISECTGPFTDARDCPVHDPRLPENQR